MKTKSFKTKSNNGSIVKVNVVYLEKENEAQEDSVIFETRRVIPESMFRHYDLVNSKFPMYLVLKQTENYAILHTRSAPMKISTFNLVSDVIHGFISE